MDKKQQNISILGVVFCSALATASLFIPDHEGNKLKAYRDVGGVWTACGGVAYVDPSKTYTAAECKELTNTTIGKFMVQVAGLVPGDTPADTLAAYTSFAYNIGISAFSHSSTLQRAKAGDIRGACEAMLKWYKAGGRDCRVRSNNCYGVWQRRQDERALCLKGVGQ